MKFGLKRIVIGLIVALLVASGIRAISARQAQKASLETQQATQKTQSVLELASTDLIQVKSLELAQGLAISGPLKAVNSALVKARVAGELQDLSLREGDVVRAGQIIARIDATEYQARVHQAQQQAESARAQVDIAKRSFDNNRSLVDQGFISKTALESSMATLSSVESNYRAAQAGADVARKALEDTVLRAPIGGLISQRLAQPGERVAVEARIVEIVDLSRLELEASLSATESLNVKPGQMALLTLEGASQPVRAKVVRVNPSVAAASRAVLAYLALDPGAPLRQGMFVEGTLHIGSTRTLAVPLSAVRTDKPQPYVQRVSQGQVMHQTVTLGLRGDLAGQAMVGIQGVDEGDMVLSGTVGTLRVGTWVKLTSGTL